LKSKLVPFPPFDVGERAANPAYAPPIANDLCMISFYFELRIFSMT